VPTSVLTGRPALVFDQLTEITFVCTVGLVASILLLRFVIDPAVFGSIDFIFQIDGY
jgi:hypothetical protein